ncbi:MAG: hypothetical protein JXD22_06780 [Sedimentisphaerales bacterium]|nr:hypothetical protein [Sedimentisphaerales bacterium]
MNKRKRRKQRDYKFWIIDFRLKKKNFHAKTHSSGQARRGGEKTQKRFNHEEHEEESLKDEA